MGEGDQGLSANYIETGTANVLQRRVSRRVMPSPTVTQRRLDFEARRPNWLREMIAEALGVFFLVYCGTSSTASFILNGNDSGFGSIFQIGWAYGIGIALAIIVCAPTSGGHLNPAITICLALWKGFPWRKVPQYIFAQVFGSFMAGLFVLGQYKQQIWALKEKLTAEGVSSFNFNGGPGSVLCSFPNEDQRNLGYMFLTEFLIGSFIALVIWSSLDPANPFASPLGTPFIIGLAFSLMIWGFADITVSANMARDLGTRIVAAIFFGGDAFTYHKYSWIGILGTVPASIFATTFYEMVLKDSALHLANGYVAHSDGPEGLNRHLSKLSTLEDGTREDL